jgi:hypothetical protein
MNDDSQMNFSKNTMNLNGNQYDEQLDSKKSIILLTESPNMNLYSWASDAYIKDRNIQKQVYSGYKPETSWKTVIFQMVIVFYIMETQKFTFRDMKLNNNFYIKDINVFGDAPQFWKYCVDKIDFYVPNYGHLLLFDSDYHDIETASKKIIAIFLDSDKFNEQEFKKILKSNALECININNFSQEFTNNGGNRPQDDILNLINKISDCITRNEDFKTILLNNFTDYLHNRIGTSLRQLEFPYIKKRDVRPFIKGELVVSEKGFENYVVVIFLQVESNNQCKCITKDGNNFSHIMVPKDLLYHFSEYETIKQDAKPNEPYMSLDYIIETYNL